MDDPFSNVILPDAVKTHTNEEIIRTINRLRDQGDFNILLKPHVDIRDGSFRGRINPTDVHAWFDSYRAFILHYAVLASIHGVEMFAIGTELQSMTDPGRIGRDMWDRIISEIRTQDMEIKQQRPQAESLILTYAANWDGFTEAFVPFWDRLDMVGIDAYFPLSNATPPSLDDLKAGWMNYCYPAFHPKAGDCSNWLGELEALHNSVAKPIMFTEVGYRSIPCAAKEPFFFGTIGDLNDDKVINEEDARLLDQVLAGTIRLDVLSPADIDANCQVDTMDLQRLQQCIESPRGCNQRMLERKPSAAGHALQSLAYEATLDIFQNQSWFQGPFWWAWFPFSDAGGPCDTDFTPQNKPAESTLIEFYL